VNNVQVTVWIMLWVSLSNLLPTLSAGANALLTGGGGASLPTISGLAGAVTGLPAALRAAFAGFTLPVWGVVMLKAMNGILIPATFKYADNLLYSYAKPSSIVATTLVGAAMTGTMPAPSLLAGVALVVVSVQLYSSKPKAKQP